MRDGRMVAVKVRRPGVVSRCATICDALAEIAAFADRHSEAGERYDFSQMVAEFRNR